MAHNIEQKVEQFIHSGEPGSTGREVFEDSTAVGSGQAYNNNLGTGATGTQPGGTAVQGAGIGSGDLNQHHHSHSHGQGQGQGVGAEAKELLREGEARTGHHSGTGAGADLTGAGLTGEGHHHHSGSGIGSGAELTGTAGAGGNRPGFAGDNELSGSDRHQGSRSHIGEAAAAGLAGEEAARHGHQGSNTGLTGSSSGNTPADQNAAGPASQGEGHHTQASGRAAPPYAGEKLTPGADGHHVNDATQHRWATHEEAVAAGYAGHEGPNAGNGGSAVPASTGTETGVPVDQTATGTSGHGHGSATAAGVESELKHDASATGDHHKKGLMEKIKEIL